MNRGAQGAHTDAAARLEAAADLISRATLPMLLAQRGQPWQTNAAFGQLLPGTAPWPAPLDEAVTDALDQDTPAPRYSLEVAGIPGPGFARLTLCLNLHFVRVDRDTVLCMVVDNSALAAAHRRLALAERATSHREMAYATVYGNMEEVAYHVTRDGDGHFIFESVNHAFCAASGMAQDDVVGRRVDEVLADPAGSTAVARFHEAIDSGATVHWEQVTDFPWGQRVGSVSVTPVYDADGEVSDLIGTVHDITLLKRAEQKLRALNHDLEHTAAELRISEERLGFALDSAGEGVWDWDIAGGTVFYSRRFREILGRDGQDPAAFDLWWSLIHPDDVDGVHAELHDCLSGAKTLCVNSHRVRHAAGRWIWVEARGSIVARDSDGMATRMVGTIVDITATTELRQELGSSYELLARLAQQVPGALFQLVMAPDGKVSCPFISVMASELFHLEPAQIEQNFRLLLHRINRRDRVRLRQSLRESARLLQPWRAEYRVMLDGGGTCWRELAAKPARRADGVVLWHGFTSDISERKRTEDTIRQFNEKLERRAHYDTLTGLPNRVLFRDRLEQEMRHASIGDHGMALLFIDLDRFKEVNDLLGHDAGDALLTQVARRIGERLRPGDTVARLGGDEFTVILTETDEVAHIEQTAQHIIDELRAPFQIGIEQVNISASIGITLYPGDGRQPEDLMRNADHAMYRSKAAGRDRLTFFEPAMQRAAMRRLKLTSELRHAMAERQLELHFQPILDNRSGTVSRAEALLRWRRPGHELLMPSEFIGIAEETGMIHEIGNWVFFEAADCSARWSKLLGRTLQISINKSPIQFQQHGYSTNWIGYLDRLGLPHNSIAVEITEGVLLHMSDNVFRRLHELHLGGVEVSIDDFGTGYSSMSYLKRLDIDYLKIDQSFVAEMLHDRTSQTITETIIVMAHKLGLKVIAEGVETAAQRGWLSAHGCDFMQGFLFARPLPGDEFEQLLLHQPFMHPQAEMTRHTAH